MHFFASNLLYYLQVDVVDSEFDALQKVIAAAADFQGVLRAHRNFLATVLRVSMVDQLTVQEGVERVLQVCLRFIAVCRLLQQQEGVVDGDGDGNGVAGGGGDVYGHADFQGLGLLSSYRTHTSPSKTNYFASPGLSKLQEKAALLPVVMPPEELEAVKKEFFSQISFLFQVMRKVENRGFIFRLDFNNFLSEMATSAAAAAVAPEAAK